MLAATHDAAKKGCIVRDEMMWRMTSSTVGSSRTSTACSQTEGDVRRGGASATSVAVEASECAHNGGATIAIHATPRTCQQHVRAFVDGFPYPGHPLETQWVGDRDHVAAGPAGNAGHACTVCQCALRGLACRIWNRPRMMTIMMGTIPS